MVSVDICRLATKDKANVKGMDASKEMTDDALEYCEINSSMQSSPLPGPGARGRVEWVLLDLKRARSSLPWSEGATRVWTEGGRVERRFGKNA